MSQLTKLHSFFDHFEELRKRIIKTLVVFMLTSCGFYGVTANILPFILRPAGHLIFTSPGDAFNVYMHLTLWGGFIISLPFTFYQIWDFAGQALTPQERKYIVFFLPLSLFLFLSGGAFAFFVVVPIAYRFLMGFSSAEIVPMITVNNYISFVGTWVLSMGVTFELPLVLAFLARIGVATPAFLSQKRKHAIVLILVMSAVLTPPDLMSQILMAAPLLVLYEIGIILARITYRK